jgi:HD-like signal output (HDOD) protein
MKSELVELIDKIPMLPETIQKIEAVYQNPNAAPADMVKAIQGDPLLIARILKLANSPLYGLSRTVTDISHAISLLGRDMVRTFAIADAANSAMTINLYPYNATKDQYLDRAALQHAIAVGLAMKISRSSLSYVSLGSYLLDLGRVAISSYVLDTHQEGDFSQAVASDGASINKVEIQICGAKSEDVTATIFNHWKFEPDLIYVIRYANEPEDAADEDLKIASTILKVAKESVTLQGTLTEESIQKGRAFMEEYGLSVNSFNGVVDKIRAAA